MKFIVNLKKTIIKTIVVEADSLEECDKKALEDDVLFATERTNISRRL